MALAASPRPDRDFTAKLATGILAAACLLLLTRQVIFSRGNLGWDDADYLRRGLANARLAAGHGPLEALPRSMDLLLLEQPKPPFLVAWLMIGASLVGRANLDALIVHGSVLPFALLMLATVCLAHRLHGARAGLLALLILVCSPRALAFGGKVMVETFLGLWVMLALALAAGLAVRPSRKAGAMLGLATALALLTKLTAVLLLAGAVMVLAWWIARRAPDRPARLRAAAWAIMVCIAVAGPWYARNLPAAVRFGLLSSRFNLEVEGRSEVIAPLERLLILLADLPGWPLATILGSLGMMLWFRKRQENVCHETTGEDGAGKQVVGRRFRLLAVSTRSGRDACLDVPPPFRQPVPPAPVALAGGGARWNPCRGPLVPGTPPSSGRGSSPGGKPGSRDLRAGARAGLDNVLERARAHR